MSIDHAINKALRKKKDMFDDIIDQIDFTENDESDVESNPNKSPLPEVDYKNRHYKYHVTRRYLREDDSKYISFENTTLMCTHLAMVNIWKLGNITLEKWPKVIGTESM